MPLQTFSLKSKNFFHTLFRVVVRSQAGFFNIEPTDKYFVEQIAQLTFIASPSSPTSSTVALASYRVAGLPILTITAIVAILPPESEATTCIRRG